jgi:CheY-like chemotaxis protein
MSDGYEVDTAETGREALALLARKPYAAIVLDYQMPEMNGAEVLHEAKQVQPDLIGVFVTAYTTVDKVFSAVGAGAVRVLPKPVDAREFTGVLQSLLAAP